MDRVLIQYALNIAWQLPVLAAGAWLLVRIARPGAATQHRIWVAVLALAVLLPFFGAFTSRAGLAAAHIHLVPPAASSAAAAPAGTPEQHSVAQGAQSLTANAPHPDWLTKAQKAFASLHFARQIEISARTAQWITGVYLLVMLLGLVRIAIAWSAARRLVQRSHHAALAPREQKLVADCARRMRIKAPEMRVLEGNTLSGPAVVGAARPLLLCPDGFLRSLLTSGREDEATAALCHEMAHIRRHDYAVNLACEVMAAPLRWHPVTYGVERRIRGTREMACDAAAARAMHSQADYARCLVGLAEKMAAGRMVQQPGVLGLFNGNALEERVMQLIDKQTVIHVPAKIARTVVGAAAMAAAVALVGMVQVVPARAQAPDITAQASQATPSAPIQPAAMALPTPPVEPTARQESPVVPPPPPTPVMEPKAPPAPPIEPLGHHEVIVSRNGEMYAWVDGHKRKLTPAERARVEKQLEEAQKKVAAAQARINSPEFKAQIRQAEHQAMLAQKQLQSGEIQRQMAQAQAKIAAAQARINSPEFKAQIRQAEHQAMLAQKQLQSGEIQRQMAQAQARIAAEQARINSPEFREQIQKAVRAAQQVNMAKIQAQMAEAQKNLQKQLDQLKKQPLQTAPSSPNQP